MPFPGTAWDSASPADMGFDPSAFATALAALPGKTIVIRSGYVIGTKGDLSATGYIWSAAKSLTALIFARQLQLGNVAYDDFVPDSAVPTSPSATYRQFLSMTSDFNLTPHSPGDHYAYNNGGYHHVGTKLKEAFYSGRTHVQTLQDAYVTALGFEDALVYEDPTWAGQNHMGGWNGGWSMSTRDMARIGYLVLRNGNWNGTQILSESFIHSLWTNQIPATATPTTYNSDEFYNQSEITVKLPGGYSFGFWLSQVAAVPEAQSTHECLVMSGAFGTSVSISRKYDLVIATVNNGGTTTNPGPRVTGPQFDAVVNSFSGVRKRQGTYKTRIM